MRRIFSALLVTATVIAVPVAASTAATAAPLPEAVAASGVDLGVRLGGLAGMVHVDRGCVSEELTGKLLRLDQYLAIGC
ncbi:hypothetical protein [Amycolatopsis decaplanina]|uniref:Secreted protein n=1 Tax=Amycolatopsis decaplanina DSM 44594 TaxID=1284240 RepID=M2YUR0_9PSEU|nr:hypothetical protein [Amycolatopsis decaplanina]EME58622.1 hypothetical protein H074_18623 [Amycolatopsis decaplanina DSM 44594]